jgi:hypothetical protein
VSPDSALSTASAALSGLLWSVCYVLILRRGFLDRSYGMPAAALFVNLAWELIFGFVHPDRPPMCHVNQVWFVIDCVILYQYLRFGRQELPEALPRRWFLPAVGLGLVTAFLGVLFLTYDLRDWQGNYSGWGAQLLLSLTCIAMLLRRRSVRGQSVYIGLSRMLGTVALIPFQYALTPGARFLLLIFVLSPIFDGIYLVLLVRQSRAEGIDP